MPQSTMDRWRSLDDYKADISRYVAQAGPYSHNLVAISLRQIEREYGPAAALATIKEFDLGKKFGIRAGKG